MNLRPGCLLNGLRRCGHSEPMQGGTSTLASSASGCASESQEAKRMGSALVSDGLVELALFTMT